MDFLPNGIFAESNIRRTEISLNGFFAVGIFAERNFRRILWHVDLISLFSDLCSVFYREMMFLTKKLACVYMCIYVYKLIRPLFTFTPHYLEANRMLMRRGSSGIYATG